jgi:hypothetical protein
MEKAHSVLHYSEPPPEHPAFMASTVSAQIPKRLAKLSFEEVQSLFSLEDKYPEMKALKTTQEKREFAVSKRAELQREMAELDEELKAKQERAKRLHRGSDAIISIDAWSEGELKIERPDGVSFRRLRKAVAEGRTIYLDRDVGAETPAHDFEKEVFRYAEIMMIEHDWAGAFQNADLAGATVKLPYDVCAFEFKFSGRVVVALATQLETDIAFSPAIECEGAWMLAGFVTPASGMGNSENNSWIKLFNILGAQIRAACIALDAEVAKSEVVREPYTGSHGKNSYHPPKAYHVVSLAHRRARPLAAPGTETGRRIRLHFRRGHWRHFEQHKTWIKWMLVGDPDLGFVDKHYKL